MSASQLFAPGRWVWIANALAALCALFGLLYANYYMLASVGVKLPAFWLDRFYFTEVSLMLFQAAAILGVGTTLLLGVQERATVAALERLRCWLDGHPRTVDVGFAVVAGVLAVGYTVLRFAYNRTFDQASLERLTTGWAYTPFQYRYLVPGLVHRLVEAWPVLWLHLEAIYRTVEILAAFGVAWAFRGLVGVYVSSRPLASVLSLLIFYPMTTTLASPTLAQDFYYPYDTPSLLFFALGLWLMVRGRWAGYYALFVVATFNRETTCFLTMVYALTAFGRVPFRRLAGHVSAQFVLWVGIKMLLAMSFPDTRPYDQDVPLFAEVYDRNLWFFQNPLSYPYLLLVAGGLWLIVVRGWRHLQEPFVKRGLLVTVPFLLGMGYVGIYAEIRIFLELIPLTTLAFLLLLRDHHRRLRAAYAAPSDPSALGPVGGVHGALPAQQV